MIWPGDAVIGLQWIDKNKNITLSTTASKEGVELMAFTGLHDKIGTEIYEGDLIRNGWNEKEIGVVTFDSGSFDLGVGYVENLSTQGNDSMVIGNIYEHPDLKPS